VTARASTAQADDLRIEAGYGQAIHVYAISLQLDRHAPIHQYQAWTLTGHVDFTLGEFQGHRSSSSHATTRALWAIGKLRWQRRESSGVTPFAEFGLGIAGFSDTLLGGARQLGGTFEFTEVLRTGCRFGERKQFEISVYGEHFSNAGLAHVNDGITFAGLSFAWYFR
jgi:hypothetical protein